MIWGMTLEPGKLYTEVMGEEVQLSMAAIESRKDLNENPSNSFCQIVMKTSKGEYVLCTLVHGVMFQQNLDLKIMPREKVTFSVQGTSVVYLVGYTASYPEDEDEFGDMREDELDESESSSAWEAFDSDSIQVDHIKEEPIDIPEDEPQQEHPQTEGETPVQPQLPSSEPMEERSGNEQHEEIIFSIPELDGEVKSEVPDPKTTTDPTLPPEMTPQDDIYGMQPPTDQGTTLPPTSTDSDYFYPETQQQPEVALTPLPTAYQPTDLTPGYPQGALPPSEQFLPLQRAPLQQSQVGPIRHGRGANAQRNYPPQRRQYPANRGNRGRSPGKSRSAPQPINVQQMRNIRNVQQEMPGPSQPGAAHGPSTSDDTTEGKPYYPAMEGVTLVSLDSEELAKLSDQADSENTKKQVQYAVRRLEAFAEQTGTTLSAVEGYEPAELDGFLSRFYAGLRRATGALYTKKSMHAIRYGLHRHFQTRTGVNICCRTDAFRGSNAVWKGMMAHVEKIGKGDVQHTKAIQLNDMVKILRSLDFSTPEGLQNKVFLDIMIHFHHSREGLRKLTVDDFEVKTDESQNSRYIVHRGEAASGPGQGDSKGEDRDGDDNDWPARMVELPGSYLCPVASFLAFREVMHPGVTLLWQRPKPRAETGGLPWYTNQQLGVNTLGNKMKVIAEKAGCSQKYTNHSIGMTSKSTLERAIESLSPTSN